MLEEVKGLITKIILKKNNFCVFKINNNLNITAKNAIGLCEENTYIKITGIKKKHEKYGEQIEAIKIESTMDSYIYTILLDIKNFGEKTVNKLKKEYGDDFIEILENEPMRIENFINNKKRFEKLKEYYDNFKTQEEKIKNLEKLCIKPKILSKIYDNFMKYDNNKNNKNDDQKKKIVADYILDKVKKNPYKFVIYGININIIDNIAMRAGNFQNKINYRKEAEIYLKLCSISSKEGGYYWYLSDCIPEFKFLNKFNEPYALNLLCLNDFGIMLKKFDNHEENIYHHINEIRKKNLLTIENNFIYNYNFDSFEIKLTDKQKEFIKKACVSPISILTGGPGTGKSTTVKILVNILMQKYKKHEIALSALSGVAVDNLKRIVNKHVIPTTLHRIIFSGVYSFCRICCDYSNKESCKVCGSGRVRFTEQGIKVLIIDELSLVDVETFSRVLNSINVEKIIMLGDPNQLPSIQPGQLLIDLLKVKSIPNIKLDKVQRQKDGLIIDNAYRILKGDINLIFDGVQCTNRNIVDDNELLYYYKNEKSVHIVTLTREESRRINNFMQDKSNNNPAYFYEYYKKYFKLGDKVKQNINNYNKAVFNGEIGIIIDISSTYVEVKYYSKNVLYKYNTCEEYKKHEKNNMKKKRDDIGEIDLAYSTTIHSTQGNEYDVVFIILIGCQFMLNRNIIYTALTRAKKHAIVIGEKKIINYGINKEYIDRPTLLDKRFDPKINLNSYEQTFSKLDSIQKTDSYIFITPDIEDEDNINICASDFNANNYEVIYCKNK